ncbi:MAG: outer rane receptor protein mostly Fe transport [Microbacterium sp.]|jgi:hypothetical protein|nr:outer rane receptor protein mostly Fe transport [Microbacterium sp.]MDF2664432.1 outer rane receptor protein mostly Fe transport [Microbacterium sp.]
MNDLSTLFAPTAQSDAPVPSGDPGRDLRRLVGEPEAQSKNAEPFLEALTGLVGAPAETEAAPAVDLRALVGGDEPGRRSRRDSASQSLSALVSNSGSDTGWLAPELSQPGRRPLFNGRRRAGAVNLASVAIAVLAIVLLAGTATFAVVQRATTNPADDAMISLREREAELRNETQVLQTAADLYTATLTESNTIAASSEGVLATLQGRVDQGVLDSASRARATLVSVAGTAKSVSVPEYNRAAVDEKSLTQVAEAIDDVRIAREALQPMVSQVREARAVVVSALDAFRNELRNVGSAIEAGAAAEVARNDAAADSFRTAVTEAASRVRAAQLAGGDGLAEMPTFASALDALRAENTRVLELRAAEEEDERSRTPQRESDPPSRNQQQPSNPQPSDPPTTDPTTPPAPEPTPDPTTEPEPEPEPQPTFTEPPANGGTGEFPG